MQDCSYQPDGKPVEDQLSASELVAKALRAAGGFMVSGFLTSDSNSSTRRELFKGGRRDNLNFLP